MKAGGGLPLGSIIGLLNVHANLPCMFWETCRRFSWEVEVKGVSRVDLFSRDGRNALFLITNGCLDLSYTSLICLEILSNHFFSYTWYFNNILLLGNLPFGCIRAASKNRTENWTAPGIWMMTSPSCIDPISAYRVKIRLNVWRLISEFLTSTST